MRPQISKRNPRSQGSGRRRRRVRPAAPATAECVARCIRRIDTGKHGATSAWSCQGPRPWRALRRRANSPGVTRVHAVRADPTAVRPPSLFFSPRTRALFSPPRSSHPGPSPSPSWTRGLRGRAMLSTSFASPSRFRHVSRCGGEMSCGFAVAEERRRIRWRVPRSRDALAVSIAKVFSGVRGRTTRGIIVYHRERACRYLCTYRVRFVRGLTNGPGSPAAENGKIQRVMCSGFRPGGDCTDLVRVRLGRRHCRDSRDCIYV